MAKGIKARGNKESAGRVILLSNSLSTYNKKRLPEIFEVAARYPFVEHLEGNSLERLYKQLKTFRGQKLDLLILNGGDGTIHSALTFVMNNRIFPALPKIAILGGGMTNMIAKNMKTGGHAADELEGLLDCYAKGEIDRHIAEHSLVRIDFSDQKQPQFGMFYSSASMPHIINFCVDRVYRWGIKGKTAQLISLVAFVSSFLFGRYRQGRLGYAPELDIILDEGNKLSGHFTFVATTTLGHLIFNGRAHQQPGTLPFLTLRPKLWGIVLAFFHGVRGTIHRAKTKAITLDYAKKVTIRGANSFMLDGEIYDVKGKSITLSSTEALKFVSFRKE